MFAEFDNDGYTEFYEGPDYEVFERNQLAQEQEYADDEGDDEEDAYDDDGGPMNEDAMLDMVMEDRIGGGGYDYE